MFTLHANNNTQSVPGCFAGNDLIAMPPSTTFPTYHSLIIRKLGNATSLATTINPHYLNDDQTSPHVGNSPGL